MIRRLIIILSVISIGFIFYEIIRIKTMNKCPLPHIEYRYVPRSFKEEQDEPVPIDDIFNKMFANPSPWMMSRGIGSTDKRKTNLTDRKLNSYFNYTPT